MKITVLGSGSKGNCTYYETDTTKFMIDCGLSYRQVTQRLGTHDIVLDRLDALFVTHEHSDHVAGIASLISKHDMAVYLSSKAYGKMHPNQKSGMNIHNLNFIEEVTQLNDVTITAIKTSHDSAEALGFIIEENGHKVVHITDTGYVPKTLYPAIQDADYYLFESNYDPELLLDSSRPFYLKQRIMGNQGHLSNEQAGLILNEVVTDRTKGIIFLHLSEECNTAFDAKIKHKEIMERFDELEIEYSFQHKATSLIEL